MKKYEELNINKNEFLTFVCQLQFKRTVGVSGSIGTASWKQIWYICSVL